MTELVEHMGIQRRSLYDTFGDKHTLFFKVMDRIHDKVSADLLGEVKRSKTATEALQLIFKTTELFILSEQLFKDIILWGQQNGEFSSDYDASDQADHLHAVYVGLRVMTKTSIRKEKLHHIADVSIKLLSK
ncbi:TetR/AcrR family transcriptional regulator [Paenibacillus etheri]|uniref:HTH tetR-type domain-containing protein n=1 Tax=Paenibacillus etheri TaxID=1306852 RepID=A0A0W1AZK9_9BACL|nr:hypothetical protein [Paenibacillus etheri]KTD86659.1 hypothetical protein UQ64_14485 [Paenibacillus etheri]